MRNGGFGLGLRPQEVGRRPTVLCFVGVGILADCGVVLGDLVPDRSKSQENTGKNVKARCEQNKNCNNDSEGQEEAKSMPVRSALRILERKSLEYWGQNSWELASGRRDKRRKKAGGNDKWHV